MAKNCHNTPGMPEETLAEIHDCLTLALDATESPTPLTQSQLEARWHITSARHSVERLMEVAA